MLVTIAALSAYSARRIAELGALIGWSAGLPWQSEHFPAFAGPA
jgi:hypothetical protein